ncbi:MAG: hypothetical protein HRT61_00245 [Ekhidna sp.]|nr:hypothetical protein [Ekhidna sp.]
MSEYWAPQGVESYHRDGETKVLVNMRHGVLLKQKDAPSFRKGDMYMNHDGVRYLVKSTLNGTIYLEGVVGYDLGDRLQNTPYLILTQYGCAHEEDWAYE